MPLLPLLPVLVFAFSGQPSPVAPVYVMVHPIRGYPIVPAHPAPRHPGEFIVVGLLPLMKDVGKKPIVEGPGTAEITTEVDPNDKEITALIGGKRPLADITLHYFHQGAMGSEVAMKQIRFIQPVVTATRSGSRSTTRRGPKNHPTFVIKIAYKSVELRLSMRK